MRRRRFLLVLPLALLACRPSGPEPLTVRQPLHLEEHLDAALVTGSEVPKDLPKDVEWRFDVPRPEWKPAPSLLPGVAPAAVSQRDGALRIEIGEATRSRRRPGGGVYVDLPGWNRQDWAWLVVRARARGVGATHFPSVTLYPSAAQDDHRPAWPSPPWTCSCKTASMS